MSAREQFDDPRLERLQLRILELEKTIKTLVFLNGGEVETLVDTTPTRIKHRLGRPVRGFLVLSSSTPSSVALSAAQPDDASNAVHLEASAQATFKLWFF